MNILLMNHRFWPTQGGVESSFYYIGKALIEKGCGAFILTERYDKSLKEKEDLEGITILRHSKYPRILKMREDLIYLSSLSRQIKMLVEDYKIDSMWTSNPLYTFSSLKVCRGLPIIYLMPTVFPVDTWEHSRTGSLLRRFYLKVQSILQYYLERQNVKKVHSVVVFSNRRKLEVSEYYKINENKIRVIYPGVDSERFQPRPKDVKLLEELNINKGEQVILTVARLEIQKNILRLVEEFSLVEKKDNLKLVIVGDGSQRKRIEKFIVENRLEKHVILCGARDDVERFYSIAELFVLPSRHEGFGQVLCEAFASGIPCMGFRNGIPLPVVANDEIINHMETGILVDYNQYGEMAKFIEEILMNREVLERFANKARESVLKKFNWDSFVERLQSLL